MSAPPLESESRPGWVLLVTVSLALSVLNGWLNVWMNEWLCLMLTCNITWVHVCNLFICTYMLFCVWTIFGRIKMHKTLILELASWTQRLGIGVWGAKAHCPLVFLSLPPFCLHPGEAAAQCSPSEPALGWMLSTFGIGDAGMTPCYVRFWGDKGPYGSQLGSHPRTGRMEGVAQPGLGLCEDPRQSGRVRGEVRV